jgi:hypothetical protein
VCRCTDRSLSVTVAGRDLLQITPVLLQAWYEEVGAGACKAPYGVQAVVPSDAVRV